MEIRVFSQGKLVEPRVTTGTPQEEPEQSDWPGRAMSLDRLDYRTSDGRHPCHIPVGMPQYAWRDYLDQGTAESRFVHARWAARRIARQAVTLYRTARWSGSLERGHEIGAMDVIGAMDTKSKWFTDITRLYQVAEPLRDYCYEMARERVQAQLGAKP